MYSAFLVLLENCEAEFGGRNGISTFKIKTKLTPQEVELYHITAKLQYASIMSVLSKYYNVPL